MPNKRARVHRYQVPRQRRSMLPRPRIMTCLSDIADCPLTVIKAGAGYGKTTALGAFVLQCRLPVSWLTLTEDARDASAFVRHVLAALLPDGGEGLERVLDAADHPLTWMASADLAAKLVQVHAQEETLFVLDDFHVINEDASILAWLDQWLRRLTTTLHVIIVSRIEPNLPILHDLRLRGEVLFIRERELMFNEEEAAFLFQSNPGESLPVLDLKQIRWLLERTGGMAMVLSLLWRDWKAHQSFAQLQTALEHSDSVREQIGRLFLTELTPDSAKFFLDTSVLSALDADVCDAVMGRVDSADLLRDSERKGFLVADDDGQTFRLHPLVREHLQSMLTPADKRTLTWRAIHWYRSQNQISRAVAYLFALEDEEESARELLAHIPGYLAHGQVSTVQGWLERLSPRVVAGMPGLLYAKAEVARFSNQFPAALRDYEWAEEAAEAQCDGRLAVMSLLGRARLYLDTIQPSLAQGYIRSARRRVAAADVDLRHSLLQVAFENAINQGRLQRASRLQRTLSALPGAHLPTNNSDARLLLRSGRPEEAIALLALRVTGDEVWERTALSHREATLLLALLYCLTGLPRPARTQALQGFSVGDALRSPFVRAVGYIRLGHAEHLRNPLSEQALEHYQNAERLMDEMSVTRGKAEALLGLCLAYGYRNQLELATEHGERGIAIAERVQDTWMASLVRLGCGQAYCVNEAMQEAVAVLTRARQDLLACGDPFLACAAQMWRAVACSGWDTVRMHADLAEALHTSFAQGYEFLWLRPTYFGLRDVHQMVPLLQAHRATGPASELAARVLHALDCTGLEAHPGYTLRVQTFGAFRVWRGFSELSRKEWQREKARQLFQYFLTHRGEWLHREQIAEGLWSDAPADVAERDFKVALNGLSVALEPHRPSRGPTAFIARQGSYYQLTSHALLEVDRDKFLHAIHVSERADARAARKDALHEAVSLYVGDYLPDARYEGWSDIERERLRQLYLRAAVDYARLSLEDHAYAETIQVCNRVIQCEPTWEAAYVLLMQAYGAVRDRPMVIQTYRTCTRMLQQEYGVDVMETTTDVYRSLIFTPHKSSG